jgi:homoserine kinase
VIGLTCPRNLHLVTITPEYAVSTETATKILKDKTLDVFAAESAASRYMDIRHALDTGDLDLLIRSAGNRIVEPYRGQLIDGLDSLYQLVNELNSYDRRHPRFACGISGSGPTMYILASSYADADRAGYQAQQELLKRGIFSWWFCHRPNPNGAEVIELH